MTLREWALFFALALGGFMAVLDFFIVLVAIPSIRTSLAATPAQLQLIVAGYAIANAAGLIAAGKIGDTIGKRRMYLVGIAMFCLASAACAFSRNGLELVVFRIAQGAAAAVLMPQVIALLSNSFEGSTRLRLFGYYAVAMGLGGVTGQAIGGALIEAAPLGMTWQWCFLINLPIGLLAIALGWSTIGETTRGVALKQDWMGMALAAATIVTLTTVLTYGAEALEPRTNGFLLLTTAILGWLFLLWERQRKAKGLPHLLRQQLLDAPSFKTGTVTVLLFYCGLASHYFVMAVHLQTTVGLSPMDCGLSFGAMGAAFMAASAMSAWLRAKLGTLQVPLGGVVILVGHLLQIAVFATGADALVIASVMALEGFGIGMVMAPLVALAMAKVPREEAGLASGIVTTMQSAGNAFGVAAIAGLFLWFKTPTGFPIAMAALAGISLVMSYLAWRTVRE